MLLARDRAEGRGLFGQAAGRAGAAVRPARGAAEARGGGRLPAVGAEDSGGRGCRAVGLVPPGGAGGARRKALGLPGSRHAALQLLHAVAAGLRVLAAVEGVRVGLAPGALGAVPAHHAPGLGVEDCEASVGGHAGADAVLDAQVRTRARADALVVHLHAQAGVQAELQAAGAAAADAEAEEGKATAVLAPVDPNDEQVYVGAGHRRAPGYSQPRTLSEA
mmetsp:Transcript_49881/g.154216  ORF Transcript_49881/g.154216 Transcript_49881/m.154216 type:complete len:220 (-) Transcript_49881:27-686(-)